MRVFSSIILLLLLAACQKKDNTVPDAGKVVITITAPQQQQAFQSNDTVYINADVKYVSELHGYEVIIEDTATGFVVYDDVQHVHSDHFTINDKWVSPVAQTKVYKLSILASVDHSGTIAQEEIYFKINP